MLVMSSPIIFLVTLYYICKCTYLVFSIISFWHKTEDSLRDGAFQQGQTAQRALNLLAAQYLHSGFSPQRTLSQLIRPPSLHHTLICRGSVNDQRKQFLQKLLHTFDAAFTTATTAGPTQALHRLTVHKRFTTLASTRSTLLHERLRTAITQAFMPLSHSSIYLKACSHNSAATPESPFDLSPPILAKTLRKPAKTNGWPMEERERHLRRNEDTTTTRGVR